jgi:hypothetical protein
MKPGATRATRVFANEADALKLAMDGSIHDLHALIVADE